MNIEHRTLNAQHRIMYSARREPQGRTINLNKTEQSESTLPNSTRLLSTGSSPELAEGSRSPLSFSTKSPSVMSSGSETQGRTTHDRWARGMLRFACFKIDKAQRHQYSMFDVGRSMLDVQCLQSALRIHCSAQT